MKDNNLVRMSFSIEQELFAGLERLLKEHCYENRSEFIRDMIRKQLAKKECALSREVIGTVSVLCDLEHERIEEKLNNILDESTIKVLGSSRFLVERECSSTMITLCGIGADIRELVNSIRKLKGVVQAEFVITSTAAKGGSS
ncbi:MAG: hypothetical protein IJY46_08225 [Lentisphaeria bacterium]|nr:hypothetical protein [Lentisphaeria bacterium]